MQLGVEGRLCDLELAAGAKGGALALGRSLGLQVGRLRVGITCGGRTSRRTESSDNL